MPAPHILGRAFASFGGAMSELNGNWYCDEGFWREFREFIFDEDKLERAAQEVEQVLALAGLDGAGGGRVLDMPCGEGRHTVLLAGAGFQVTGVDINPELLRVAARRAAEAGVRIELCEADMRGFLRPDAFRLAINMFTSLGYHNDRCEDLRIARNIFGSLADNGVAIFEMTGREVLRNNFNPVQVEQGSKGVCRKVISFADDGRTLVNDWQLVRSNGASLGCRFAQTIYSADELRALLKEAGFIAVDLFGGLSGVAYDGRNGRLVARAIKANG